MYNYKDAKKNANWGNSQLSFATNITRCSYQEYYKRIKEMGESERLRDDEVNKYLANRPDGEKAYKRVSANFF